MERWIVYWQPLRSQIKAWLYPNLLLNKSTTKTYNEFKGDRRLFRDYLQSKGQTISEYKDEIREEIIYQHMLSSRRRMKADVSPDRIESYYKENAIKFRTNAKVKLREIVLKPIADEPITILMQQATKILSEIKDGKPFEDLAKNYGQSLYRENGRLGCFYLRKRS